MGSGIYGSVVLTDMASDEWQNEYFKWLDENADSVTGLWRKGCLNGAQWFHYLAGTFHYVFNYEYAKRELPYPKQLLDTCIRAYNDGACMDFSNEIGWADIDYTYLLARVQRRAGTRFEETREILQKIEDGFVKQLLEPDKANCQLFNDTNTLFAVVSALAVLQDALPGTLYTDKPLQLVLDKRPFI